MLIFSAFGERGSYGTIETSARNPGAAMVNLAGAVSNPPTQAEAQANRDKINKLLNCLARIANECTVSGD
jgi:hypothetical protein